MYGNNGDREIDIKSLQQYKEVVAQMEKLKRVVEEAQEREGCWHLCKRQGFLYDYGVRCPYDKTFRCPLVQEQIEYDLSFFVRSNISEVLDFKNLDSLARKAGIRQEQIRKIMQEMINIWKKKQWIFLYGQSGVGKTLLVVFYLRTLLRKGLFPLDEKWYLWDWREKIFYGRWPYKEDKNKPYIFIEDMGYSTAKEYQDGMFEFIDYLYHHPRHFVLITSNLDLERLKEWHILTARRIFDKSIIIHLFRGGKYVVYQSRQQMDSRG